MNSPRQPDPSKPIARQSMTGLRLRKHADYQRAYAGARKRQSSSMSWFLASQAGSLTATGPRVGLTAGKVLGKAHERNRIKRRMREALRRHVLALEFTKLEAEVVRILEQAKLEAARGTQISRPQAAKPAQ